MTIQKSINLTVASLIAVFIAIFFVTTNIVSADDREDHSEEMTTTETTETTEAKSEETVIAEVFEYTAQPGDSYSLMARKAVQTSGLILD